MHSARMTVLLPPDRKSEIERKAKELGISTGELVRRAVDEYEALTPAQEAELAILVEEANRAVPAMAASFDSMIETLQSMRRDIRETLNSLSTSP